MHIFITGASGEIGSHTLRYILAHGHTATATDIVPLPQDLKLPPGSTFIEADCTDFRAVEKAMLQIPCDGVIHLGAIANPRVSSIPILPAPKWTERQTDKSELPQSDRLGQTAGR